MDLTKYVGERVIYGLLDFLGDVGGFSDALKFLAWVLLTVFQFQPLYKTLIPRLYNMPDDQQIKMGWLSLAKLTLLQHLPCELKQLHSRKERAYFSSVEAFDEEINIVSVVQNLRLINSCIEHLMDPGVLRFLKAKSRYKVAGVNVPGEKV